MICSCERSPRRRKLVSQRTEELQGLWLWDRERTAHSSNASKTGVCPFVQRQLHPCSGMVSSSGCNGRMTIVRWKHAAADMIPEGINGAEALSDAPSVIVIA